MLPRQENIKMARTDIVTALKKEVGICELRKCIFFDRNLAFISNKYFQYVLLWLLLAFYGFPVHRTTYHLLQC